MRQEPSSPHDPSGVVIHALRAACPSFESVWADHIAAWPERPDDPAPYLDVAAFAEHAIGLLAGGQTTEFPAVFEAVERLYQAGDPGVTYLLTVGLLEAIQNISANKLGWRFTGRFRPWLGPATTKEWDELHVLFGTSDRLSRRERFILRLRGDPPSPPIEFGCAYCADDQNRWFGHVTRVAKDDRRGTILLRCPGCSALYETTPAGTGRERRISGADAVLLFPGVHLPSGVEANSDTIE